MPPPLQGASTSTASNAPAQRAASASGWALTTSALGMPMRSMLRLRIFAREGTGSLHTSSPSPASAAAICVLLPPGAAHRSRTRSPGLGASALTGAMALGSCR